jgi:hypothetical protein
MTSLMGLSRKLTGYDHPVCVPSAPRLSAWIDLVLGLSMSGLAHSFGPSTRSTLSSNSCEIDFILIGLMGVTNGTV